MKLWLVLSRFELGGLERVQVNLAPVLAKAGLEIWIVAGRFLPGTESMFPNDIYKLEIAQRGRQAFIPGLLAQLRKHEPDMVMTTSNDVACLMLMLRALFFPKMKVICTQHLSVSAPWQEAQGIQRAKHYMLLWLMKLLLPKADATIAVSRALVDDMRNTLRLSGPIHVIHNPIVSPDFDSQLQSPIQWPWPDRSIPTMVFAGRLSKVKRLDLLLEAFRQVTQTRMARLLVLGEGPEREKILEFIAVHDLKAVCHLCGHQDNPLPWIKASDLLVLPSDYEGFGNVLVEAMACGTQVISTDCPNGPAEVLDHGRYGQLVPTGDAGALAHAMQRALSKEFYVPAPGLIRWADGFNVARAADAYLDVIQQVANTP